MRVYWRAPRTAAEAMIPATTAPATNHDSDPEGPAPAGSTRTVKTVRPHGCTGNEPARRSPRPLTIQTSYALGASSPRTIVDLFHGTRRVLPRAIGSRNSTTTVVLTRMLESSVISPSATPLTLRRKIQLVALSIVKFAGSE